MGLPKHINGWKIVLAVAILLVGVGITTCTVTKKTIKSKYEAAASSAPFDAIIVPGIPFDGGDWHLVMKMRVYWSILLFNQGLTKNIIYSGSSVYTPYVEAEVMKRYALELGIPEKHIFTETRAEHSTENVYYSYHLAKANGFDHLALATDPFQTKMVKRFMRKHFKNKIDIIPTDYEKIDSLMQRPDPTIDTVGLKVENFISIKERESWWKRFKGTLGHNIDFAAFDQ